MIRFLDHVNLRTANLERMVRFYAEVLGLPRGVRPDLGFPGAWMYAGERPVIHLVGVDAQPEPKGALRLEHFAFAGADVAEFVARLDAHGITYRRTIQAGTSAILINLQDPDGNRLHVDFPAAEANVASSPTPESPGVAKA